MPFVLIAALAGSVAVHAVALFGTNFELLGAPPEPEPLVAELRLPVPVESPAALPKPAPRPPLPRPEAVAAVPVAAQDDGHSGQDGAETAAFSPSTVKKPPEPVLTAEGASHFAIYRESPSLQIGRAEHRWRFAGDGTYELSGMTETSGVVGFFRPMRQENRSRGRLVAGGLQPESFQTLRNGEATNENAVFDWSAGTVHLERNGKVRSILSGTQDILSLNYQLAYLPQLEEGARIGVVTARAYQPYFLNALGEETIDTPAGRFRTLHLRAQGDTVTEFWIALDHQRIPVRVRHVDHKGDAYVQVLTRLEHQPPTAATQETSP